MKMIALVGLESRELKETIVDVVNSLSKLYGFIVQTFFYSNKDFNLYDSLVEKGFVPEDFAAVVSLGGDGTFLYTSRIFAGTEVPVFGVNISGKMGFNTGIEITEFGELFRDFMESRCEFDYKGLLDVLIDGKEPKKYLVLNEGVISHTGISRMIKLKVDLEKHSLLNFMGDGLIVSSPTGSTAYNLSAGGPILHPELGAFVICPICPHAFGIRPFIIPFGESIYIRVEEAYTNSQITLDGQKIVYLEPGQTVIFRESAKKIKVVRGRTNFIERLKSKLGWVV